MTKLGNTGNLIVNKDKQRKLYYATFKESFSTHGKRGISGHLRFVNLRDSNFNFLADTIVFDYLPTFTKLNLEPGDVVSFYARDLEYGLETDIYGYTKGTYCRLFYPNNATKLYNVVSRDKKEDINTNKCKIKIRATY